MGHLVEIHNTTLRVNDFRPMFQGHAWVSRVRNVRIHARGKFVMLERPKVVGARIPMLISADIS